MPRRSVRSTPICTPKRLGNPMQQDNFRLPDLGHPPLVFGPPDLVEGYYMLESAERNMGMGAITAHREPVHVWYGFLTMYFRAYMAGLLPATGSPEERTAWELRSELLVLGITSSKSALDLLLSGYYSPAYAVIRHMIETVLTCRYIEAWPKEADAFYRPGPGALRPPPRPKTQTMIRELKKRYPNEKALFDGLHKAWNNMGDGSHPSGIGIVQTRDLESDAGVIGATYHPAMFRDGVRPGLITTLLLLLEVKGLKPPDAEWNARLDALVTRMEQGLGIATPPTS